MDSDGDGHTSLSFEDTSLRYSRRTMRFEQVVEQWQYRAMQDATPLGEQSAKRGFSRRNTQELLREGWVERLAVSVGFL